MYSYYSPCSVTIDVIGDNDPPVAIDDYVSTNEDTLVIIDALVANGLSPDSDPNNDALTPVSNTAPGNGAVTLNPDGTFGYTPSSNFYGLDSFGYTISDGNGETATATGMCHSFMQTMIYSV